MVKDLTSLQVLSAPFSMLSTLILVYFFQEKIDTSKMSALWLGFLLLCSPTSLFSFCSAPETETPSLLLSSNHSIHPIPPHLNSLLSPLIPPCTCLLNISHPPALSLHNMCKCGGIQWNPTAFYPAVISLYVHPLKCTTWTSSWLSTFV